jgi:hypothetical protein
MRIHQSILHGPAAPVARMARFPSEFRRMRADYDRGTRSWKDELCLGKLERLAWLLPVGSHAHAASRGPACFAIPQPCLVHHAGRGAQRSRACPLFASRPQGPMRRGRTLEKYTSAVDAAAMTRTASLSVRITRRCARRATLRSRTARSGPIGDDTLRAPPYRARATASAPSARRSCTWPSASGNSGRPQHAVSSASLGPRHLLMPERRPDLPRGSYQGATMSCS